MRDKTHTERLKGEKYVKEIIDLFAEMVALAFPYAFVFAFGGKLVHSFLGMAFDGTFKL